MADIQLIGSSPASLSYAQSANYIELERVQAVASGTLKYLKVKCGASCKIKTAIYADSSGSPGALLAASTEQSLTGSTPPAENTVTMPDLAIVSGTYYWIAHIVDTAGGTFGNSGSGTSKYKSQTYSGFSFPNPAGTGYSSETATWSLVGWGTAPGGSIIPILNQYRQRRT